MTEKGKIQITLDAHVHDQKLLLAFTGDTLLHLSGLLASALNRIADELHELNTSESARPAPDEGSLKPWVCSCGARFATLGDLSDHAESRGGLLHGDPS